MPNHVLLTEAEAAERLRVTAKAVKRWRLDGLISYLPGRPIYILERALTEFIDRIELQPTADLVAAYRDERFDLDPDVLTQRWVQKLRFKRKIRGVGGGWKPPRISDD